MTFRKRKRIKGLIVALATAAVVAPTAGARVYEGGSMGYVVVKPASSAKADYSGLSPQALQAMGARYEKMAELYQHSTAIRPDDRAGSHGIGQSTTTPDLVDRQVANIALHSTRPDDRGGIRGPVTFEKPVLVTSQGDGFDWTDAGIGASVAAFTAALLAAAGLSRRRTGLPA